MPNITLPYQQHRQAVGNHLIWQNKKQGSQQSQNRRVQNLAAQPGLHSGNLNRQCMAQACVQLLSMLSSVHGSNTCFATSAEKMEERAMENRLLQADTLFHHQRAEQAIRRESDRNSAQEGKAPTKNNRAAVPDWYAESSDHAAGCSEITTENKAKARLPADRRGGALQSAISKSSDMFTPAGNYQDESGLSDAGVLNQVYDFPRRGYAGVNDAVAKAGSWLSEIRGPILFAQASPVDPDACEDSLVRRKTMMLNETAAHDFLTAFIGGEDGKFMADEISKATTGKELMLTSIPQSRIGKRASLSLLEKQEASVYHEYLRNNCHIRTKTVHGHPIGDHLLLTGEYVRNPWRAAAEAINEALSPGSQLSETAETVSEYVNLGSDIIFGFLTLGVYPIIKYGTSKSLSAAGQATNGDMTCLKREFSPEEMARLLFDTEVGITHHQPFPIFQSKPAEIAGGGKFRPSGLFIEQHLPSGISMEKYMAIRKDGAEVLIREKTPGEFVTYHPQAADPAQLEQRVIFEPKSQRIFFGDDVARERGYDFSIVEGRKFIEVQGEQFELHYNRDKQRLEIQVEQGDVSSQLPVYKEKLSHTWHLGVHNNNPVFADWQKTLIARIKIDLDATRQVSAIDNLNPAAYGNGKIYEVREAGAASTDPAGLHVIEMHGELVPVRMQVVEGHGIRYEAYDMAAAKAQGRAVEWDGQRWIFEKNTSVHVAPALKRMIDGSMFDRHVSVQELSAPDRRGIRWDRHDRGYLKIKGGYVRVRQYGYHPDAWYMAHAGKKINLFFHHSRFHPETARHRLQRLQTQGMSGRGAAQAPKRMGAALEKTAADIVQNYFGYTREQAVEYLRQFHFEPNGRFSEMEFALQLERYDAVPQWARLKPPDGASPVAAQAVSAADPGQPIANSRVTLGAKISEGSEGIVYVDANDGAFVIKKLKDIASHDADVASDASVDDMTLVALKLAADEQVSLFNRYYGAGKAEAFIEGGGVYVRMPKIPGKELRSLAKGEMPDDGVHRYVDMLERLEDAGIWHGDLHERNVFFDIADNMFYPLDFSNYNERFRNARPETRRNLETRGTHLWDRIIKLIRDKQNPSPGQP